MDIRKVAGMKDPSLKVALSRLVRSKKIFKLGGSLYATDLKKIKWEKLALELYSPSYLSFEYALARQNILSQQTRHIILATGNRTKTVETVKQNLIYHHINPRLFWGYRAVGDVLLAEPEKAFLDLAYLSLNGYAKFDPEEMNLALLDKAKIKKYLAKYKSARLSDLIEKSFK